MLMVRGMLAEQRRGAPARVDNVAPPGDAAELLSGATVQ